MKPLIKLLTVFLLLILLVGCRKNDTTSDSSAIAYLTITPSFEKLLVGEVRQFYVSATYKTGEVVEVESGVSWATSNSTIASFNTAGVLTVTSAGSVQISASFEGAARIISTEAVIPTDIAISAASTQFLIDQDQQMTATAALSDGSSIDVTEQVTWASSDSTIALVSDQAGSRGVLSLLSAGTTSITATAGSIVGTYSLTAAQAGLVSIQIEVIEPKLIFDAAATTDFAPRIYAIGIYEGNQVKDISTEVFWSSTPAATFLVGSHGETYIKPASIAVHTITAFKEGVTGSWAADVVAGTIAAAGVHIWPVPIDRVVNTNEQLEAWSVYAEGGVNYTSEITKISTWTTANPAIIGMDTAVNPGRISTLTTGTTTVTATLPIAYNATSTTNVVAGTHQRLDITPAQPYVPLKGVQSFQAMLIDSNNTKMDATQLASWDVLDVNLRKKTSPKKGQFTRRFSGESTIVASLANRSGRMTVKDLNATLSSIEIQPSSPWTFFNIVGADIQLKAFAVYDDGSRFDVTSSVYWENSDSTLATVYNNNDSPGLVRPIAAGTATVTAHFADQSATATLTVDGVATVTSVEINPQSVISYFGHWQQFSALAVFSNNKTLDVTRLANWSLPDFVNLKTIPKKEVRGAIYGFAAIGTPVILTANYAGTSGTATISNVDNVETLSNVTISMPASSLPANTPIPLQASAVMSDNNTFDVTGFVTWESSDPAICQIANDYENSGTIYGLQAGTVTISAHYQGQTATQTLTITP